MKEKKTRAGLKERGKKRVYAAGVLVFSSFLIHSHFTLNLFQVNFILSRSLVIILPNNNTDNNNASHCCERTVVLFTRDSLIECRTMGKGQTGNHF